MHICIFFIIILLSAFVCCILDYQTDFLRVDSTRIPNRPKLYFYPTFDTGFRLNYLNLHAEFHHGYVNTQFVMGC